MAYNIHYNKLLSVCILSLLVSACGFEPITTESTFATNSVAQAEAAGLSHGEYVARLGNCVACHTTEDGAPLAGGLEMNVPLSAISIPRILRLMSKPVSVAIPLQILIALCV